MPLTIILGTYSGISSSIKKSKEEGQPVCRSWKINLNYFQISIQTQKNWESRDFNNGYFSGDGVGSHLDLLRLTPGFVLPDHSW